MSILTQERILKEIADGTIKIVPFDKKQVGPASIDLHLGDVIWAFKRIGTVGEASYKGRFQHFGTRGTRWQKR